MREEFKDATRLSNIRQPHLGCTGFLLKETLLISIAYTKDSQEGLGSCPRGMLSRCLGNNCHKDWDAPGFLGVGARGWQSCRARGSPELSLKGKPVAEYSCLDPSTVLHSNTK